MKKVLFTILLFTMLAPFVVNGETCDSSSINIESIVLNTTTGNAEEGMEASVDGKKINLDLKLYELGDSIEYNLKVINTSDEDFYFDDESLKLNTDYLEYEFIFDDNSNIVEASNEKNVRLRVKYENEVPTEQLVNGSFNGTNTLNLSLSNKDIINVPDTLKNLNNRILIYILLLVIVMLIIFTMYIVYKKKKYEKFMLLLLGTMIIIPINVYALCKCDIEVKANVEIFRKTECNSFAEDDWDIISNNIKTSNTSCYHVGDTKLISVEGYGQQLLRIANMSTPIECSNEGYSQTACGFVIEFTNVIDLKRMNPGGDYSVSYEIGKENYGSWEHCEVRDYVNDIIYDSLPSDLKKIVINTTVISGHGNKDSDNFTTNDKLYLISAKEVFNYSNDDSAGELTRQLDYYFERGVTKTTNTDIPIKNYGNSSYKWWLRTPYKDGGGFSIVQYSGYYDSSYSSTEQYGISPAFRIS